MDKYDANKSESARVAYTYRVLESASAGGHFYGGTDGDVIEIGGKKYKVLNTTRVTGDSTNKTLTLTNQLQDAKYKLVITKQDAQDNSIKLGGVEFKLEKLNTVPIETPKTGTTAAGTGELTFADLTPGNYRLTETKTAEGYTLLAEPIEFTLTADGQCRRDGAAFWLENHRCQRRVQHCPDCLQPQGLYPAAHGRGRTQPVAADRFARTGGCAAGAGVPIQ